MRMLLIPTHMDNPNRAVPLGIGYIAAYLLKLGHVIQVYDPLPFKSQNVLEAVDKFKPDAIGLSCVTPTYTKACEIAKEIKTKFNIPIIFGGVHPTALPEEVLKNDFVDFVVCGEGEVTFAELLTALSGEKQLKDISGLVFKQAGTMVKTPPRQLIENLDDIPFPARQLFDKWYFMRSMIIRGLWLKSANVIASRGCPYGCTYCASKVLFGRQTRFRSAKNIADEIEHLIKEYKVEAISFSDDLLVVNKPLMKELYGEIKRRKIKLKCRMQIRADCVTDELVKMLKDIGCVQFDVGVESGSEKTLKLLNKNITPEHARNAFKIFKQNGVRACASFMLGSPGETMDDINKTVQLARDIAADYTSFFITTPYPGTPIYNDLAATKQIEAVSYEFYHHGGNELRSLIKNTVSHEQLLQLQTKLDDEFQKNARFSFLMDWQVWRDMTLLVIRKPDLIVTSLRKYLKTKKLSALYKTFYYAYKMQHGE